jgi:hypothetical protein
MSIPAAPPAAKSLRRGAAFVVIAGFFGMLLVLGVMLAFSLYQHDVRIAERTAESTSQLLTTSILSTMMRTGDKEKVRALMAELKTQQNFGFRIYRSEYVERQFGLVEGERPMDEASRKVFETRKPLLNYPNDTTLRSFTPLITDQRCQQCHQDLAGKPIQPGVMLGAYEVVFDLSKVKAASIKLILQVVALVVVGLTVCGVLIFRLVATSVLDPIQQITYVMDGWKTGDFARPMPNTHSKELRELTGRLEEYRQRLVKA